MSGDVPLSLFEKNRVRITSCAVKMEGEAGKEGQIPSEDFGRQLGQVLATPGSGRPLRCSLHRRCFETLSFITIQLGTTSHLACKNTLKVHYNVNTFPSEAQYP
jgi:hypothetical protein